MRALRDPLYDYIHPWLGEDEVEGVFRPHGRASGGRVLYLMGHSHHQFYRAGRVGVIVNPGSVGQPRDGDPRASYALIDPETGLVSLGRVEYDVESVVRAYSQLGVPEPYLSALATLLRTGMIPRGWPPRV